jgi:hypothetical protein
MREITMTNEKTAEFPSAEIPGLPSFSVAVPEGWTAAAGADVLLVLLSAELSTAEGGTFRANITVDATRARSTATIDEIAASSLAHLEADYGTVAVIEVGRTDVDGRPAYAREVEFTVPGGPTVRQIQVIADLGLTSAPHLRALLSLAATCAASEAGPFRTIAHSVVESARIN